MTFNNSEESLKSIEIAVKEAIQTMQEKKEDFLATYNLEECDGVVYHPEECVIHFTKGGKFMYEFNVVPIGTVNPFSKVFRWIWSHPAATQQEVEISQELKSLSSCMSPMFEMETFSVEPDVVTSLLALSLEYLGAVGFVNVNLRDTPYYVGVYELNAKPIVDPS